MEEMGNPFLEESRDLLRLDTRDIVDEAVASLICQAAERGKEQFQAFVTNRLIEGSTPHAEPISRPPPREKSKASLQVSSLKNDVSLFSRLYIACQSRDGDLDDFFCHGNQPCPPSALSHLGKLRQGPRQISPIHEIVASIGPSKSQALPMFHAYTGCDTVSSFATRGKKSAWDTWRVFEEATATFLVLSTGPDQVNDDNVATLDAERSASARRQL